jgi:hypothetical protein
VTPFIVQWEPEAEQELARLWLAAADRDAMTQATHRIDHRLARDPEKEGEELSEGLYLLLEGPLAAFFEIHADQNTVIGTQVTLASPPPPSGANGKA